MGRTRIILFLKKILIIFFKNYKFSLKFLLFFIIKKYMNISSGSPR